MQLKFRLQSKISESRGHDRGEKSIIAKRDFFVMTSSFVSDMVSFFHPNVACCTGMNIGFYGNYSNIMKELK